LGGKIRSRKQWDAYQKLVAYYNHQKTVNALMAETFDKEPISGGQDKKCESTNAGIATKRDSAIDLMMVATHSSQEAPSSKRQASRALPSMIKDYPGTVISSNHTNLTSSNQT
jgi:hypothetical protein